MFTFFYCFHPSSFTHVYQIYKQYCLHEWKTMEQGIGGFGGAFSPGDNDLKTCMVRKIIERVPVTAKQLTCAWLKCFNTNKFSWSKIFANFEQMCKSFKSLLGLASTFRAIHKKLKSNNKAPPNAPIPCSRVHLSWLNQIPPLATLSMVPKYRHSMNLKP